MTTLIISTLIAKIQQLEQENAALSISPSFGVLIRAAVERKWESIDKQDKYFLFFDIDNLHELNATYGYDEVNKRVSLGLATLRSSELLGLVFSGDEFVAVINKKEVEFLLQRLRLDMLRQGITVTCGIVEVDSDEFNKHYKQTKNVVQQAKAENKRDCVVWVYPQS
jgi:GGDEF domain-containing protein